MARTCIHCTGFDSRSVGPVSYGGPRRGQGPVNVTSFAQWQCLRSFGRGRVRACVRSTGEDVFYPVVVWVDTMYGRGVAGVEWAFHTPFLSFSGKAGPEEDAEKNLGFSNWALFCKLNKNSVDQNGNDPDDCVNVRNLKSASARTEKTAYSLDRYRRRYRCCGWWWRRKRRGETQAEEEEEEATNRRQSAEAAKPEESDANGPEEAWARSRFLPRVVRQARGGRRQAEGAPDDRRTQPQLRCRGPGPSARSDRAPTTWRADAHQPGTRAACGTYRSTRPGLKRPGGAGQREDYPRSPPSARLPHSRPPSLRPSSPPACLLPAPSRAPSRGSGTGEAQKLIRNVEEPHY